MALQLLSKTGKLPSQCKARNSQEEGLITVFTSAVANSQESQYKLMIESKTISMLNSEISCRSKRASSNTLPERHEIVLTFLPRYLLSNAPEADTIMSFGVEEELSELRHFLRQRYLKLDRFCWISCFQWNQITLNNPNWLHLFLFLLLLGKSIPSISQKEPTKLFQFLTTTPSSSENGSLYLPHKI